MKFLCKTLLCFKISLPSVCGINSFLLRPFERISVVHGPTQESVLGLNFLPSGQCTYDFMFSPHIDSFSDRRPGMRIRHRRSDVGLNMVVSFYIRRLLVAETLGGVLRYMLDFGHVSAPGASVSLFFSWLLSVVSDVSLGVPFFLIFCFSG